MVTIRTNNNNSSDSGGWCSAQVVAGGGSRLLIPTSFTFSVYDVTTEKEIFSQTQSKGGGNANQKQSTVTCTQTQTATLADLLQPGDQVPPGASLTDTVTFTLRVTAVQKP